MERSRRRPVSGRKKLAKLVRNNAERWVVAGSTVKVTR
jgi:hypothetical protein